MGSLNILFTKMYKPQARHFKKDACCSKVFNYRNRAWYIYIYMKSLSPQPGQFVRSLQSIFRPLERFDGCCKHIPIFTWFSFLYSNIHSSEDVSRHTANPECFVSFCIWGRNSPRSTALHTFYLTSLLNLVSTLLSCHEDKQSLQRFLAVT